MPAAVRAWRGWSRRKKPAALTASEVSEDTVEAGITRYLAVALPEDAVSFHICNEGKRNYAQIKKAKSRGLVAGVPDRCVIYQGRAIFLEAKRPKGWVMSDTQKTMHASLRDAGAVVAVVHSPEDVERVLTEAGVPLRAHLLPFPITHNPKTRRKSGDTHDDHVSPAAGRQKACRDAAPARGALPRIAWKDG